MPVSQNQRLRKAAAKAAKRKAVVAQKIAIDRRGLSISRPGHIDFATSPIVICSITANYATNGMGSLNVSRKLSLGRYAISVFLLDTWCLGVKDAVFRVVESAAFDAYAEHLDAAVGTSPLDPARARKLLRDAAAYGEWNGFPPPADFAELERIFGDIKPADESFTFGDQGKPHYFVGPSESRRRVEQVRNTLERRFGRDGFYVTEPLALFDHGDEEYDDDDVLEGKVVEVAAISAPAEPDREQGDLRAA